MSQTETDVMTADELNALRLRLHNYAKGDWARKVCTKDYKSRIADGCLDALDQFDRYESEIEQLRLDVAQQTVNAKTLEDERTKRQQAECQADEQLGWVTAQQAEIERLRADLAIQAVNAKTVIDLQIRVEGLTRELTAVARIAGNALYALNQSALDVSGDS